MHERAAEGMNPLTLCRHRHGPLIGCLDRSTPLLARSPRFRVYGLTDDVVVVHDFTPAEIDNNIGGYVANELLPLLARARPAPLSSDEASHAVFERCVGAIVRSVDPSESRAWHLFYDNTLAVLRDGARPGPAGGCPDFIGEFRDIYQCCAQLLDIVPQARVLDVASCFGFLPLYLALEAGAGGPERIVGCDLNPALMALADGYCRQRQVSRVSFVCADLLSPDFARKVAGDGDGFDMVTAIHLLEHLEPEQTGLALDALWALARRRLMIAVPFEAAPDPTFGHRQVFDLATLAALGRRTGGQVRCFAHHGGWLVVDRTLAGNGAGCQAGEMVR